MVPLLRIIKILNSDTSPSAIAAAISLALFFGLTPLVSPHNLLVILIVLLFRVHLGSFILASFGFGLIGLAIEPLLDRLGLWLLSQDSLVSLWTSLYNTHLGRLSFFNYTTMAGGLFVSLLALAPVWFGSAFMVNNYREHFLAWSKKTRLLNLLRTSTIMQAYFRTGG